MSRISLVDPKFLPAFLKELHDGATLGDWSTRRCARAFSSNPELLENYLAFYYPWHRSDGVGRLEPRLKELVRLRIATLNGCKTCKAARLASDVTEEEASTGVDSNVYSFSPRESAAIHLAEQMALIAEQMALNHHDIKDDDIRRLREIFEEDELLELMMMAGQYIGFGRMLAILQLENTECSI